ncbi:sulfatase-like hydrolase/transferase, partial [Candidatus Neomarinimicrobiota bacterium]
QLHPVMEYMAATKNSLGEFSGEEILAIRRTYYAMIAETDAMVGELVNTVEDMDLDDSTYIIYISDHGEMNMEHRQWLKNSLYEGSVRVPMIIAGPGVKEGLVVDDLVSLIDIFPTLMDMTGLSHPGELAGLSLMPLMQGRPGERPDWVLSQYHANFANTGTFMLRRGDWKYIAYVGYEPMLFNLREDPDEMLNLALLRPDVVRAMDAQLREIVDYKAVDTRVKAYDRESFTRWRAEVGAKECSRIMDEVVYKGFGWSPKHDRQLAEWLAIQ